MLYAITFCIVRKTTTVEAESLDEAYDKFYRGEIQGNESAGKLIAEYGEIITIKDENGDECF